MAHNVKALQQVGYSATVCPAQELKLNNEQQIINFRLPNLLQCNVRRRVGQKRNIMNTWSESRSPNSVSHYDHCTWETPLGTFIIEWKSWKESPDYGVELNGNYIGTGYSLGEAQQMALSYVVNMQKKLESFLGT